MTPKGTYNNEKNIKIGKQPTRTPPSLWMSFNNKHEHYW